MKSIVAHALAASLLMGVPALAFAAPQAPASHVSQRAPVKSHTSANKAKSDDKDSKNKDSKSKNGHKAKSGDKKNDKNDKNDKSHDSGAKKKSIAPRL